MLRPGNFAFRLGIIRPFVLVFMFCMLTAPVGRLVTAQESASDDTSKSAAKNPSSVGSSSLKPAAQTVATRDVGAEKLGARALSRAFRDASKKATPSVVTVLAYGVPREVPEGTEGQDAAPEPDDQTLTNLGSGVIVNSSGRILTNNHVIAGAKRVEVQLVDETRHEATSVIGDPSSDVAVLEIDLDTGNRVAEWGDSDEIQIGDWVLAIGSPFQLEATVSAGIISAKNREIARIDRVRLMQTDAAINPGNSGGPLIDLDGRVIGINTAIASRNGRYQGIGFAVPINQARWIADELSTHARVRRAAIGVTMAELNARIAGLFKKTPNSGVLAYEIIEGSSADVAGIERLDVIVSFGGKRYTNPAKLREAIERELIGSSHPIVVERDGQQIELTITLASVEDPTLPKKDEDGDPR